MSPRASSAHTPHESTPSSHARNTRNTFHVSARTPSDQLCSFMAWLFHDNSHRRTHGRQRRTHGRQHGHKGAAARACVDNPRRPTWDHTSPHALHKASVSSAIRAPCSPILRHRMLSHTGPAESHAHAHVHASRHEMPCASAEHDRKASMSQMIRGVTRPACKQLDKARSW